MIIYRYLSRQLFWSTLAVSSVLTFILVASRFLKFLSQAAVGKLEGSAVFLIMAYRLPDFLELILPLGLFLGVLLSYGRMYLENEMVVLQACGVSQKRLLMISMVPALCMSLAIGFFSFYLSPWGGQKSDALVLEQEKRSGLEVLSPRRFHSSSDGRTVTYVEEINSKIGVMNNLFIVTYERESRAEDYRKVVLLRASEGRYRIDQSGNRYLVMSKGERFQVDPGDTRFGRLDFDEYTVKLEEKRVKDIETEYSERLTKDLWGDGSIFAKVELQWRFSLMLMVPIVVLMAVPLSKVNPRQGRYLKMLPAILMYLIYLSLLIAAKGAIEKGKLPLEVGMLSVHVVFFMVGIALNGWPGWKLMRAKKRMDKLVMAKS